MTSVTQACYALRTRLRMPKKSKKEKIIAELRRKVQTQQILTPSPTFQYQAIKESLDIFKKYFSLSTKIEINQADEDEW